jgi:hypothetical protein
MDNSGGVGERGVAARLQESAKSRTRREMAVYGEGVRQRDIDRAEENREAKRRRGELLEVWGQAPSTSLHIVLRAIQKA